MNKIAFVVTSFFLTMGAGNAHAAADYFLQIGDIRGESAERSHRDWIDITSFSWNISNTGSTQYGGGKATFSPFSWTQQLDRSVPPMFVAVASGKSYPRAILEVQDASRLSGVFFKMEFDDVQLTRLNIAGSGDRPDVAAAFEFSRITMTYRPIKADGSLDAPVVGGWDLKSNNTFFGSAEVLEGLFLAEPSPVPLPPALWLFGAGLLGLVGVARKKN